MNHDLILCGWRVSSALALPELLPWTGDERAPDVEISFARISEPTSQPIFQLPCCKLWQDGTYLLDMNKIGRFGVRGGKQVLLEPAADADETELRAFILSTILGVLCHQRGLMPIHASAVNINGQAVLISGNSGAGKSTLAAALGARGHALLTDDVAAFDPLSRKIIPSFPQRKLALDSLEALQLDHSGMLPNRPGQPKFRIPARDHFSEQALSATVVYLLRSVMPNQSDQIKTLPPAKMMHHANLMIFRHSVGLKIQSKQAIFNATTRLVQQTVIQVLPVRRGPLSNLEALAAKVEAHALQLQAAAAIKQ